MPSRPVQLPERGVADNTSRAKKPAEFADPRAMLNCWLWDTAEGRYRLGTRAGLTRLVAAPIGTGEVQGLIAVNRAAATGFQLGAGSAITGDAKSGAANAGHFWAMDQVPSIEWEHNFDVTDDGPAAHDVNASTVTPDGTKIICACNFLSTSTGKYKCRVRCLNAATGATLWTHEIADGAVDRYCRTITTDGTFVFVCTNKYVRVLLLSTGNNEQEFACNNWSYETVECDWYTSAGARYLLIAFIGSLTAGTVVGLGGVIQANEPARDFRSGVMLCRIFDPPASGPYVPLVQRNFSGIGLGAANDGYEANHQYLRFSEIASRGFHGVTPQGIRAFSNGSFVVVHNNHGWGPSAAYRPDPTESGGVGYYTVSRFNADGTQAWSNHVALSVTDDGSGEGTYALHPHYNDILNPTFTAIEIDASENIFVAGCRNTTGTGYSVYSLTGAGLLRWDANVTSARGATYGSTKRVRRGAITIDPSDGNLLLAGDRNSDWDGAGGLNAHMWKLNASSGEVLQGWDFGVAVAASSVAAGGGRIFLGTEKV